MQEQSPPTHDNIAPAPESNGAHPLERVLRKLADARNKLVDRNLRNRLISTPLESSRTKSLRVWGSECEQIFTTLFSQKKQMTFLPIPDEVGSKDESDEQTELGLPDAGAAGETVLQTKLTKTNLEKKLKSLFGIPPNQ